MKSPFLWSEPHSNSMNLNCHHRRALLRPLLSGARAEACGGQRPSCVPSGRTGLTLPTKKLKRQVSRCACTQVPEGNLPLPEVPSGPAFSPVHPDRVLTHRTTTGQWRLSSKRNGGVVAEDREGADVGEGTPTSVCDLTQSLLSPRGVCEWNTPRKAEQRL